MKKLILAVLALLATVPSMVHADSYTSLWKQVETACRKDLPRDAMSVLDKIYARAAREQAYGQVLKSQLMRLSIQSDIAPDSLADGVRRLDEAARHAEQRDKALAAVYRSVLGTIYQDAPQLDGNYLQISRDYFKKSLQYPDALARQKSDGYEPAVIAGIDSKLFHNDLLHILGIQAGEWTLLHDYYNAHDNRQAACICALKALQQNRRADVLTMRKSKYMQSLDSLMRIYQDLPEAGEIAIARYDFMEQAEDITPERKYNFLNYVLTRWGSWPRINVLRNALSRLTLPSFLVSMGEGMQIPHTLRKVIIADATNIQELRMTVYRLNISGDTRLDPQDNGDYARLKKLIVGGPVATDTRRYVGLPSYQPVRDSMEIKGLPIGVYLVEFTTDNSAVRAERALLRVSDMYIMYESLPDKKVRLVAVSATTGQPIPRAHIRITSHPGNGQKDIVETLVCDNHGEVTYAYTRRAGDEIYAYTDTDRAMGSTYFGTSFYYSKPEGDATRVSLYTDRRIYRPGQQVHVSALAYKTFQHEDARVSSGQKVTLTLRDANYKEVAHVDAVTDDYGMASADFTLPSSGLTGTFSVRSSVGNGYTSFRVEAYKRPTFQIAFDKLTQKYADGDTVTVRGTAKSFAGVPVQGAKVAVRVARRPSLWWRYGSPADTRKTLLTDTVVTGRDGAFTVRVPMLLPETADGKLNRYYSIDVEADATDVSGETRHGETSLPLSDKPTALSCDVPDKMLKDSLKAITFRYTNNAGEPIDGTVRLTIDGTPYSCEANKPFPLAPLRLSPARHQLSAICGTDTIRQHFVVFSMSDKRPVVETHDWFYVSAQEFPRDGSPVYVQVGSSDADQHIVYTAISGNTLLASGSFRQSNALRTRALKYKESYGDGIVLTFAWVKNGVLYKHAAQIRKPLPDKRLTARWTTFRDRLTPGQKETWTLHITRPDGKAAQAQLMATLYDKSLDLLQSHFWTLSPALYRSVASTLWRGTSLNGMRLYGEMNFKPLRERDLDLSHFDETMFPGMNGLLTRSSYRLTAPVIKKGQEVKVMMAKAYDTNAAVTGASPMAVADESTVENRAATGDAGQLRENLEETAFFTPGLTTDADGNVSLSFTLPESVTTWRFLGVAHDKDMNYCLVDSEAVASKTVMIQPNVPRFLRAGDKGSLSARVFNTSDNTLSGTARMQLLRAGDETVVSEQTVPYTVEAGGTAAVRFDFDMAAIARSSAPGSLLICRVTASGKNYEDGEQHYLPLMPDKEQVTNTLSFTLNGAGSKSIDLSKLFAVNDNTDKLTVEYTDNPAWLMIQALPGISDAREDNAVSLAAAYYATGLAHALLNRNPQIKTTLQLWKQEEGAETSLMSSLQKNRELKSMTLDETPWVMDADHEADQKQQLINYFDEATVNFRLTNYLGKLQKLQNQDGSFSWWPDMPGSLYMTTAVTEMLVRLNVLLGTPQKATSSLIDNALAYLGKQKAEEVVTLKKLAKKGVKDLRPSEASVNYLYLMAIDGRDIPAADKADIAYLVGLLEKQPAALSIYGKANTAIILNKFGHAQKAAESLESIRQYTVYKEEMGRYFDTPKALYSWCDYRIPSQVAAIEALKTLTPTDTQTITEMQRWLLQEKRTQAWTTPINSVNATYAFLSGEMQRLTTSGSQTPDIEVDGRTLALPTATAGLGYVKASQEGAGITSLTVTKSSTGVSWGAAYAQFMQETTAVAPASSGLKVTREVLTDKPVLSVGDRVKVRLTVTADRDYDFVQVSDRRAACLEPVGQLSGYRNGYYCTPRDNTTNYYFDRLAKGKHVIETEYYVDRTGSYSTGTCTVQCAYSPDFSGRDAARQLTVE